MNTESKACKYLAENGSCAAAHLEPSMATPPEVVSALPVLPNPYALDVVVDAKCTVPSEPKKQKTCSQYGDPNEPSVITGKVTFGG